MTDPQEGDPLTEESERLTRHRLLTWTNLAPGDGVLLHGPRITGYLGTVESRS
jgi:hypothetical protein